MEKSVTKHLKNCLSSLNNPFYKVKYIILSLIKLFLTLSYF